MNIYEQIHSIKSTINLMFNNDNTNPETMYNSYYQEQSNEHFDNPYITRLQEEVDNYQRERDQYNEQLEEQFNNAMNEHRNNRQTTDFFSNMNENNNNNKENDKRDSVSIMSNHVVDELKSLYESNQCYPDCSICLEPLRDFKMLSCGHKFCCNCLSNIDKCAFCRKQIQK